MKVKSILLSLVLLMVSSIGHAWIGNEINLDSLSSASAFNNPALMSRVSRPLLKWKLQSQSFHFEPITHVVVENNTTSDQVRSDQVDTEVENILGQSIQFVLPISKGLLKNWSIGGEIYLPLNHLTQIDSGEPYVPEYFKYRSRYQRPEFHFGISTKISDPLSLGIGFSLGTTLSSQTRVFLQTDLNKSSSMRIQAKLKQKLSPYFGLSFATPHTLTGLVIRAPLNQEASFNVKSSARVLGSIAALDFDLPVYSSLYYDPLSIEFKEELNLRENLALSLDLQYKLWKNFQSPTLKIENPDTTQCSPACGTQFSSTKLTSLTIQNQLIPSLKVSYLSSSFNLGVHYAYLPGLISAQEAQIQSSDQNFIDPSSHLLTLSTEWSFLNFLETETPWSIQLSGHYQKFNTETVTKSQSTLIGAPGYEIGGYSLGLSGGLSFKL